MQNITQNELDFFKNLGINYTKRVLDQAGFDGELQIALSNHLRCKTLGLFLNPDNLRIAESKIKERQVLTTFKLLNSYEDKCIGLFNFVIHWEKINFYNSNFISIFNHAFKHLKLNGEFLFKVEDADIELINFISNTLKTLGFNSVSIYSDYNKNPYIETSNLSIFVVKKTQSS